MWSERLAEKINRAAALRADWSLSSLVCLKLEDFLYSSRAAVSFIERLGRHVRGKTPTYTFYRRRLET